MLHFLLGGLFKKPQLEPKCPQGHAGATPDMKLASQSPPRTPARVSSSSPLFLSSELGLIPSILHRFFSLGKAFPQILLVWCGYFSPRVPILSVAPLPLQNHFHLKLCPSWFHCFATNLNAFLAPPHPPVSPEVQKKS